MSRRTRFPIVMLWTIVAAVVMADKAMAYIGPGSGMEVFTYAMGLIAMVGVALLSILMWPFYTFMRWLRGPKTPTTSEQPVPAPADGAQSENAHGLAASEGAAAVPSSPPAP